MRASSLLLVAGALWLTGCADGPSAGGDALPPDEADASTESDAAEPDSASEEIDGSGEIDDSGSGADDGAIGPDSGDDRDALADDGSAGYELEYLCGFRGEPALPEALLAAGAYGPKPTIASPQTLDAWLIEDRVLSQAKGTGLGNELAYIQGGFVLWSAETGLQLAHADEGPLAAAADAFLTFGYELTSDARRVDDSEFLRLRALSDGAVIRTFPVPNARNLIAAQGGLATDASYAWLRSEQEIRLFERDGTQHTIAGSHRDSVIYGAPDGLWVGHGSAAPEVVRMSRDGTVSFTTSGVIGNFVAWAQDGLHFATETGNLVRIYTRDGALVLGPLDTCSSPYYLRGDLFACWTHAELGRSELTLYDLASAGALLDTFSWERTLDGALVTAYGYQIAGHNIRASRRSIEALQPEDSPDLAWWDGVYVQVRREGATRRLGCGEAVGAWVGGGRIGLDTAAGTFLYDTSRGRFDSFFDPQRFLSLSVDGARMLTCEGNPPKCAVYQRTPTPAKIVEVAPPQGLGQIMLSASGQYVGRFEGDLIGAWEVLELPELTVVASGTGAGLGLHLSPSATSVATHRARRMNAAVPTVLYRGGVPTGFIDEDEFIDGWLSDTQPVLGERVFNMDGSVAATARCSSPPTPSVTSNTSFQALSATDYYWRGRICTIAEGSDPLPEVRRLYLASPLGLAGDLGVYIPGRPGSDYFALAPWRD